MLIYAMSGRRDLATDPVARKIRGSWEFYALLQGSITIDLGGAASNDRRTEPTLWAFPPGFAFGLSGSGSCARAVFDFNTVPTALDRMIPDRGYYRVSLRGADRDRIRVLSSIALESLENPTQLTPLKQNSMVSELSLLVLQEVEAGPLTQDEAADVKVQHALAWYAASLTEGPGLEEVAQMVHRSPAHVRRLFHKVRGESPKAAFLKAQMEEAGRLLRETSSSLDEIARQVGLSGASVLSRSVKKFYGLTPAQLREKNRLRLQRIN